MKFSVLRIFSNLFLSIAIIAALFAASTQPIHAQTSPYLTPNTAPDVQQNLNTFTQGVVISSLNSVSCVISGVDFLSTNHKCLEIDSQTGKLSYAKEQHGLTDSMAHIIGATYIPAASSQEYVRYLSDNFITNKNKAYAQANGLGYQGLSPLANVWKTFRNFAYLLLAVLFVFIGLGIMLRVKLDPKATMTVENSIPKIVIALILITFSYAIAGVMIDAMYVFIYLIINLMQQADPNVPSIVQSLNMPPGGVVDELFKGNFLGIAVPGIFNIVGNSASAATTFVSQSLTQIFKSNPILSFLLGIFNPGCWGPSVFKIPPSNPDWAQCAGEVFNPIIIIILWLVFYIAIILALFRLWWSLLKCYIIIVIDIALAPFYIALGLIPGSNFNFGTWMRSITANLAVFPATVFLLMLAKIFTDQLANNNSLFIAPMVGNVLGTDAGQATGTGFLIAFGIIIIAPSLIESVKEQLKAPKPTHGTALGAALAVGAAVSAGMGTSARRAMWAGEGDNETALKGWALGDRTKNGIRRRMYQRYFAFPRQYYQSKSK